MSYEGAETRERGLRRGRYLVPKDTPNRAQILAGYSVALLIVHLIAAQAAALVAIVLFAATQGGRLKRTWLAFPLAAGAVWTLVVGPAAAFDRHFVAGRQMLGFVAGVLFRGERDWHVAFVGWQQWIPQQFPLALLLGSLEAMAAVWLVWLHTDEWRLRPTRPGITQIIRQILNKRNIQSGGIITKDGVCPGIEENSGRRVELTWREIGGNLMCLGGGDTGKSTTCFQIVYAAIRRRKPVIAIDTTGDAELTRRFHAACAATDTPFQLFSPTGPAYYGPLAGGDPARRADLVMSLVDWNGVADHHRRGCARYLQDVFETIDVSPAADASIFDDLVHLSDPANLRSRAESIPDVDPRRSALLDRIRVSSSVVTAEPQAMSILAGGLREIQSAKVAEWLRPDSDETAARIDVESVIRNRSVALFSLDSSIHGASTGRIGAMVIQDLITVATELRAMGVGADGLVWIDEFPGIGLDSLPELLSRGRDAGLPVLLSARYDPVHKGISKLTDVVGVYVFHRVNDPEGAERLSRLGGERVAIEESGESGEKSDRKDRQATHHTQPSGSSPILVDRPVLPARTLQSLPDGRFALLTKAPKIRLVPRARVIPAEVDEGS